jgi:pilus assembly protein CpaB
MKAVTVRVNDVEGVAGFVLPGDRVDVLVTRQQEEKGSNSNDVVLQNIKVLAVDQIADERMDKPTLVKAVTLEVDTVAAQKLALAASVGNLALVLRKAGDSNEESSRRITLIDIGTGGKGTATQSRTQTTVMVIRAAKKEEYSVPVEASAGAR